MAKSVSIHVLTRIEKVSSLIFNACKSGEFSSFGLKLVDHTDFLKQMGSDKMPDQETIVELLRDADVLVACPDLVDVSTLCQLPKLKWMQSTWAGVNATLSTLDLAKQSPQFTLTKLVGKFGILIAEYVLAYILANERFLFPMYDDQLNKVWIKRQELMHPRFIKDLSIGVLGVGSLGKEICKLCSMLGMKTFGLVHSERKNGEPFVDKIFLPDQMNSFLKDCDYICNTLPATKVTDGLLDGDIFSACLKKPVFINVGRGNVISEDSIINALDRKWLSNVVLDVFQEEPLPKTSRLWNRKDVLITPHISAVSQPDFVCDDFMMNLQSFLKGSSLSYVVDFDRGY